MASSNSLEQLEEELAAIEAILISSRLTVERNSSTNQPTVVTYQCCPLVASEEERSYVGLSLKVHISPSYPDEVPRIQIRNPRGLDENDVELLHRELLEKCKEYLGEPVLFLLIDYCQEFLTERNVPACPCAICLRHIVGEDEFTKTICFHYFHSICFGRYVTNVNETPDDDELKSEILLCPVCRGKLSRVESSELQRLLAARIPVLEAEEKDFSLTSDLRELQTKFELLFAKQKAAGGIIDIEAEAKKFLIVTTPDGSREEAQGSHLPEAACSEAGLPKPPVSLQADSSRKHKGGSGLGKRRDYGDRKRNTRRRN